MISLLLEIVLILLICALLLFVLQKVWPGDTRLVTIVGAILLVIVLLYYFGGNRRILRGEGLPAPALRCAPA